MADTSSAATPPAVERPRGLYAVRVDAKGRLKLPSKFKEYFESKAETRFFVTTMERKLVHIYPLAEWRANEQRLLEPGSAEQMKAARAVRWVSAKFGADASMDSEGRIPIPQELRAELNLNDAPIWLQFEGEKVLGYNQAQYEEMDRMFNTDDLEAQLQMLQMRGLT